MYVPLEYTNWRYITCMRLFVCLYIHNVYVCMYVCTFRIYTNWRYILLCTNLTLKKKIEDLNFTLFLSPFVYVRFFTDPLSIIHTRGPPQANPV